MVDMGIRCTHTHRRPICTPSGLTSTGGLAGPRRSWMRHRTSGERPSRDVRMIPHGVALFMAHEPVNMRLSFDRLAGATARGGAKRPPPSRPCETNTSARSLGTSSRGPTLGTRRSRTGRDRSAPRSAMPCASVRPSCDRSTMAGFPSKTAKRARPPQERRRSPRGSPPESAGSASIARPAAGTSASSPSTSFFRRVGAPFENHAASVVDLHLHLNRG